MKKISLVTILLAALFCMSSCDDQFNSTPELDKTLLWPAQSDTCALWGYINEKGEMVIPAEYQYTFGFSRGKAKVFLQDGRVAFIDQTGKIVHTFQEGEQCDDYFYYGFLSGDNADASPSYPRWSALLNSHFKLIFRDNYSDMGPMTKDGLACTYKGYFNKTGRFVIERKRGEDFCDGVAVFKTRKLSDYGSVSGAINTKGEIVIDTIYEDLCSVGNNRLVYRLKDDDKRFYGLMDTKGNIITKPIFREYAFYGDGGLMPVSTPYYGDEDTSAIKKQLLDGFIDINGNLIIPYLSNYLGAYPFQDDVAWVLTYNEGKIGYLLLDKQGNTLLTLKENQENMRNFHNGLCLIRDKSQDRYEYSYINKQGDVIYSWKDYSGYYSPAAKKPAEMDEDEMMLRMFEGTEYYPLAEQCVRNKQMRENLKK